MGKTLRGKLRSDDKALVANDLVFLSLQWLLVRPIGHLDVLSPPLTITMSEVDFIVETLRRAIEKVAGELVAAGQIPGR